MEPDDEIRQAIDILWSFINKASGCDWSVAYETTEEDTRPVGVMDEEGVLLLGSSVAQEDIAEGDARFISLMDPSMAILLTDLLVSVRTDIRQKGMTRTADRALDISRRIIKKALEQKESS